MSIATAQPTAGLFSSRAVLFLVVALFLGILSLAAVASMREDCSTERSFLLATDGSGYLVLNDGGRIIVGEGRKCDILAGPFQIPLWRWWT